MKTLKNFSEAMQRRKIFKVLLLIGIVVLVSTSCITQMQIHPLVTTNTPVPSISSTPLPMTTSTLLALGTGWPRMPPIPTYISPTAFVPMQTIPIAVEPLHASFRCYKLRLNNPHRKITRFQSRG
ncbi:MAG TPA: hypothetical protein VLX61_07525 [Anaerolineales bacterium]|nr:hypothetical protein [Anaerolineales bacterium]